MKSDVGGGVFAQSTPRIGWHLYWPGTTDRVLDVNGYFQ
jgi:hypothetical protein